MAAQSGNINYAPSGMLAGYEWQANQDLFKAQQSEALRRSIAENDDYLYEQKSRRKGYDADYETYASSVANAAYEREADKQKYIQEAATAELTRSVDRGMAHALAYSNVQNEKQYHEFLNTLTPTDASRMPKSFNSQHRDMVYGQALQAGRAVGKTPTMIRVDSGIDADGNLRQVVMDPVRGTTTPNNLQSESLVKERINAASGGGGKETLRNGVVNNDAPDKVDEVGVSEVSDTIIDGILETSNAELYGNAEEQAAQKQEFRSGVIRKTKAQKTLLAKGAQAIYNKIKTATTQAEVDFWTDALSRVNKNAITDGDIAVEIANQMADELLIVDDKKSGVPGFRTRKARLASETMAAVRRAQKEEAAPGSTMTYVERLLSQYGLYNPKDKPATTKDVANAVAYEGMARLQRSTNEALERASINNNVQPTSSVHQQETSSKAEPALSVVGTNLNSLPTAPKAQGTKLLFSSSADYRLPDSRAKYLQKMADVRWRQRVQQNKRDGLAPPNEALREAFYAHEQKLVNGVVNYGIASEEFRKKPIDVQFKMIEALYSDQPDHIVFQ